MRADGGFKTGPGVERAGRGYIAALVLGVLRGGTLRHRPGAPGAGCPLAGCGIGGRAGRAIALRDTLLRCRRMCVENVPGAFRFSRGILACYARRAGGVIGFSGGKRTLHLGFGLGGRRRGNRVGPRGGRKRSADSRLRQHCGCRGGDCRVNRRTRIAGGGRELPARGRTMCRGGSKGGRIGRAAGKREGSPIWRCGLAGRERAFRIAVGVRRESGGEAGFRRGWECGDGEEAGIRDGLCALTTLLRKLRRTSFFRALFAVRREALACAFFLLGLHAGRAFCTARLLATCGEAGEKAGATGTCAGRTGGGAARCRAGSRVVGRALANRRGAGRGGIGTGICAGAGAGCGGGMHLLQHLMKVGVVRRSAAAAPGRRRKWSRNGGCSGNRRGTHAR